jgi:hypothetical protein
MEQMPQPNQIAMPEGFIQSELLTDFTKLRIGRGIPKNRERSIARKQAHQAVRQERDPD